MAAPVGSGGYLIGWELPVKRYARDDVAHLSLLWERLPSEPIQVALRTGQGQVLLERRAAPDVGQGARRQQFDLPMSDSPSGPLDIMLSPAASQGAVLGGLYVDSASPLPKVGPPAVASGVQFGGELELLGYSVRAASTSSQQLRRPDKLVVDLHWRAVRSPSQDYKVFVHMLGQVHNPNTGGPVWAQHDAQPQNDSYPTSQWFEGQVVVDRHVIAVDEDVPQGTYTIEVGMYAVGDGGRLPTSSSQGQSLGDRVLLDMPVQVR